MMQEKSQKHYKKFIQSNFKNKKIAITGSNGFIAKHVIKELADLNISNLRIIKINSQNSNYFNIKNLEKKLNAVDYIIHLSSATGGIKFTKENMAEQYYITTIKDLNIFTVAKKNNVKKLITLGNLHAYPGNINGKLRENKIFNGLPAHSHLGIGWAKRNLSIITDIYGRNNNKTKFITIYAANCYGPGDTLDLNHGHIIPKLIIQCLKNKDFDLFGSLNAVREFIYVKDLAKIIILSLAKINQSTFFNVGSGESIKIKNLVNKIKNKTSFSKKIYSKSRIIDNSKRICGDYNLNKKLGYKIIYKLDKGLEETIKWYKNFY